MNRDQACEIIMDKKQAVISFDRRSPKRSTRPVSAILRQICSTKLMSPRRSAWNSQYVKDAFKDHVQRFERLGTYTSPEDEKLDVLIVHLTNESKLERARTAIRNFVADHLKTRDEKDAALVAFVSPRKRSGASPTSKWNTPPSRRTPARLAWKRASPRRGVFPTSSAKAKVATPRRPDSSTLLQDTEN